MSIFNLQKKREAHEYLEILLNEVDQVRIEKVKKRRSLDQNALYWLWLTCIETETGQDKDDLHIYFGKKFLPIIEKKVFNDIVYDRTSTTSLDTMAFKHYLDKIQLFAAQEITDAEGKHGIELPNPEDKKFDEFVEHYKQYQ